MADKSVLNAKASVAALQTDSAVVTAVTGARIAVVAAVINQGDTLASSVTFNTKPAGSGTAISVALKGAANGVVALPPGDGAWFKTAAGEGLSVTTGAGSTSGIQVQYRLEYV